MSLSDEEYDNEGYFSDQDLAFGDDSEDGYNKELEEDDDNLKNDSETSSLFRTMSSADLDEEIRREVNDVMSVLELEYDITSILLRHFRWNKERLLEDYMDSPDKVLYESGGGKVSSRNNSSSQFLEPPVSEEPPTKKNRTAKSRGSALTAVRSSLRLSAKSKKEASIPKGTVIKNNPSKDNVTSTIMCEICCDTLSDPSSMYRPRCGHTFCKPCWRDYARGKVEDDRIINVACMQESCKTVLLENELKELLDENTFTRYRQCIQNSYVLHEKSIKFCLYPACTHALRSKLQVDQTSILTVVPIATCTASLSHIFCFNCEMQGDHRPLICPLATKWVSHVHEDAGSVSWIISNTKVCPKCQKPVQKNGGCNHMSCSQCHASWCWGCGELSKNCDGQCHRYKSDTKATSATVNRSRAELEKWLFYYDRFTNHEKSIKLENELVARIEEKITSIINMSGMSWVEARFLQHAADILMKCRETLKWSYGMAYYLKPNNMKVLFEDLQGDLQKGVEDLSHMLEENFTADSIRELRLNIVNKAVYVQKQHQLMLKDVAEGFKEGRWKWLVSYELIDLINQIHPAFHVSMLDSQEVPNTTGIE